MKLLDLYCGAGGAGMGYIRAGFHVVGMDHNPQPHYPGEFIQGDCLALEVDFLREFDAIHASPPCQVHSRKQADWGRQGGERIAHADLIPQTRELLHASGLPFVIENVEGAPVRGDVKLCGTYFGLSIIKHRYFETNFPSFALFPSCDHREVYNPWSGEGRTAEKFREAQGTPWIPMAGCASRKAGVTGDLYNAIPPAYTEWIGARLMEHLNRACR